MKSSPTLVLLLVLLMLVCAVPVRSENACGWVLYSDITTTVDGVPGVLVFEYDFDSGTALKCEFTDIRAVHERYFGQA